MIQQNINSYNSEKFKAQFINDPIYVHLRQDFTNVLFDWHFTPISTGLKPDMTPRQMYGMGTTLFLKLHNFIETDFSAVPFYYLQFLTQSKPKNIHDIGCGWNIFKRYIPNIIGIGSETPGSPCFYADEFGYVDKTYVANHQSYFECAFSICALHFVPLSQLRQTVCDFVSMIQPSGMGFLSLNLARMVERDQQFQNYPIEILETYVRTELWDLPCELLVFDLDFSLADNGMDGNIRLVIKRSK
jgi:hypothetical protein